MRLRGARASNHEGDRMLDRRKAGRLAAVVAALGMILAACVGLAVSHYNKKPLS